MRSRYNRTMQLIAPALLGAVTAITGATAITLVTIAHNSAKVGDIIAFEASDDAAEELDPRLAVHRSDQYGCILDLATIRRHGGSLIVEAAMAGDGRSFRLHWAGDRTAPDSGDCGRSADVILDRSDVESLVLAAGGFGIGRKKAPAFSSALAN